MCSVSDIPIVGKALEKFSEVTVEFVIREFRYLLCYKSTVNNLNARIKELEVEEQKMERNVQQERDDAKIIHHHVVEWQNEVINIKREVVDLNTRYQDRVSWRCFKVVRFPNPFNRFGLGRTAAKKIERVTELTASGEKHLADGIAYCPRNEHYPISRTKFWDFGSRKDAYSKILEALNKEDGSGVIGIYGMPGVGKTTIMEEAWKQVKEKGTFDEVARAIVSQKVDVKRIQEQLASHLNLRLSAEENVEERAFRLKTRLENGKKTLLIFDDVWQKLPLHDIGIPLTEDGGFKGGKMLLTSRKRDICVSNKCKVLIEIGILDPDEAWDLFRMNVGTSTIGTTVEESVARQVCDECACLPLVIAAVGNALEQKSEVSWMDALAKLKNSNIEDVDGIDPKVYACLEWSFNELSKDAKSCLLLCSVFGEDAEISTDVLVLFLIGSGLLKSFKSLNEARIRVGSTFATLKSSSLLLEDEYDAVKLHDIIRDVATSIAAKDPYYAFLSIRCGSLWPRDGCSDRKLLNISFDSEQVHFPDNLEYPDLHTLWLTCEKGSQKLPISFFNGFKSLGFLCLNSVSLATSSLGNLTSLRVLILSKCTFMGDFSSSILRLNNLEILMVGGEGCRIDELIDLRELIRLRVLSLEWKQRLKAQSLSSLSNLEELSLPHGVTIWDEEANKAIPVSLELRRLTLLTELELCLEDPTQCLDENICNNLLNFKVSVVKNPYFIGYRATKILAMFGGSLEGGLKILLQRSEEVELQHVMGLRNSFEINNGEVEFASLTNLRIESCENVEHLARVPPNPRQIHQPVKSFSKLSELFIKGSSFKYLFCASIAKCLVQLKKVYIDDCREMEQIVRNDSPNEEDNEIIDFPKLKYMNLRELPNLRSFCSQKRNISLTPTYNTADVPVHSLFNGMVALSALRKLEIYDLDNVQTLFNEKVALAALRKLEIYDLDNVQTLFNENVALPALETLEIYNLINLTDIWGWGGKCHREDSFCQLKRLEVRRCEKLENVFRTSGARALVHLEGLYIAGCPRMKAIIAADENREQVINHRIEFFPMLKNLQLGNLPMLNSFWCPESVEPNINRPASYSSHKTALPPPALWKLGFIGLDNVQTLFNEKDALPALETLEIDNLINLTDIWGWGGKCHREDSFCQLKRLEVRSCEKLENVFQTSGARALVHLEGLYIAGCPRMKAIIAADENREQVINHRIEFFPMLKNLQLGNLPMLNSFWCPESVEPNINRPASYSSYKTALPPDLWNLEIIGLDNVQTLFNEKDALPALETLEIDNLINLTDIWGWGGKCHREDSFCQLKRLEVRSCEKLENVFRTSGARALVHLEGLYIAGCPRMKAIIAADENREQVINHRIEFFPMLKNLQLRDLPMLNSFWCPESVEPNINRPASYSSHKVALSVSRKLEINGLDNVQTLFNEKVALPALETLEIDNLINLTNIWGWGGKCHREDSFCRLKILEVRSCVKLENVFRTSRARALVHLEALYIIYCPRMKAIIAADENREQVINHRIEFFPMLKKLKLGNLPMLNSFWCPESVEPNINRPASYFSHKVVLPRLEEFVISEVTINAAEISMSRDGMDDSTSQRLRTLKLASYCSYFHVIPLDWLQNLEILTLNRSGRKGLDLFDLLGHSLRNNNNDPCGIPNFARLKVVSVFDCELLTLFPCSVFRNLQTLEEIEVQNCDLIEEIVSGDEVAATGEDIPIFQLKSIKLVGLPSLKSFCGSTEFAAFKMPSLEQVTLVGCPRMLNFTSQQISTPSVNIRFTWSALCIGITEDTTDGIKEDTTDDLNKYIQQQIEERRPIKADVPEGSASKEKGKGIMKPDDV